MDHMDELKTRVDRVISELSDITGLLKRDMADSKKAISFGQVKALEESIARMKRQGLPVPPELNELKMRLFSEHGRHQERIALFHRLRERVGELLNQATLGILKNRTGDQNVVQPPYRKPYNYEKPLGSKGYSNLEDYLIPVIKFMWSGPNHKEAFGRIAQKLDVRYNTVTSQCTRALDLTTDEFISLVNSKRIVDLLERRYSDTHKLIKTQLR